MTSSLEPEGVDFVVDSGPADPEAVREVSEFLDRLKGQPGYEEGLKRAYERLARLGIRPAPRPGLIGPDPLVEYWEKIVEESKKGEVTPSTSRAL